MSAAPDGDDLARGDVHVVDLVRRHLVDLAALAADQDRWVLEGAVALQRLVGLRDDVLVLLVGRQVVDLVGDLAAGDPAVGRLDEPVGVDPPVGGQRPDQADVGALRRLDRAHPPVVGGVHVADLEPGALAGEAARAEGREPALVGQAGERVGLVHELRQLRGPEELLDGGDHGADVDQRLGRDRLDVLGRHPLLHDALHARQADPQLVLDQLADRAQAPVAEVVDVVGVVALLAGVQLGEVADGLQHVLVGEDGLVLRPAGLALLVLLLVGEDAVARLIPGLLVLLVELLQRLVPRLELLHEDAVGGTELLVHLVAADARDVVALGVEEQVLEQRASGLRRRRLARTQLAVDVLERLLLGLHVVLLQRELDGGGVVEQLEDLVGRPSERLQQHGDELPALAVDPNAEGLLLVDVELQPRAPGGDDLRDEDVLVRGLVQLAAEVGARRADELGHHDALGAVDDERPAPGHDGEVPHEDLLLLDLAGGLVDELGLDEERGGVGDVLVPALLLGVLHVLELVGLEGQLELLGEVLDRRDLLEDLLEAFIQEPVEGLPLDTDEIRKRQDLLDLGETDTVADWDERVRQEISPLGNETCAKRPHAEDGTTAEDGTAIG